MRKILIGLISAAALAFFISSPNSTPARAAAPVSRPSFTSAARPFSLHATARPLTIRVKAGDTLSVIARRTLGSARKWPELWWPNRREIKNPNMIFTGQRLAIPARSARLTSRQLHKALDAAGAVQVALDSKTVQDQPAAPAAPPTASPQPANSSCAQWAGAILDLLGAPGTSANLGSLCTWTVKEDPWNAYGPDGAEYTHNPLNVVDPAGAIGFVNSIGVGIYPDWATGNADTVSLLNGFPDIVGRLKAGLGLCGWYSASFSAWSGGGYSEVC